MSILLLDQLGIVFEKMLSYLPDSLRSFDSFLALYQAPTSAFFEVGEMEGAFWLTSIIPGWKADGHLILWGKKVLRQDERTKKVIQELFHLYKLVRLQAFAPVKMQGACRYAERLGFSMEGVLRKAGLYDNEYVDLAIYALLKEDL